MSKRDPLRELSRTFPTATEYQKLSEGLASQSDIAVAIVGAAILEAILEKLIIKKLPVCTSRIEGLLFKNRGPMSDFHSKIIVAEALDLITLGIAEILNSIKAVRNAFAHSKIDISFDLKEVSDELSEQIIPYSIKLTRILGELKPTDPVPTPGNKKAFVLTVRMLCFLLDDTHERITGSSLLWPKASPAK